MSAEGRMTVGKLVDALVLLDRELPLVYSIDEEGNGFNYVYYHPTVGGFCNGEFTNDLEDDVYKNGTKVVCVN